MVDELTYYDPVTARSRLTVRRDNPFVEGDFMEEAGLIENIAQTCAARTGYKEKTEPQRDGVIKIGYIGMLKKMDIERCPRVGEVLQTETVIGDEIFNSTIVTATVLIEKEIIAKCEMKIFLTDKAPAAL
jgi:hypothetical protein